ncbi:hypothetical protein DL766_004779 [Monosporascus sp. MC13-8B]|nr:hypothetical protein DL763_004365 [Monosporascus cannonballus]RYP30597.1 hypothetical protein DL766_004779 [Monosporascus sp. MC13-8B]
MHTSIAAPMESIVPFPSSGVGKGSIEMTKRSQVDIIDIRQATVESNLKEDIESLFRPQEGPRKLPTLLLYDEKGLQLFEEITYLEEYYLTNYEIRVLRRSATAIAKNIPAGSMVIELGSGNLRKVLHILQALEDAGKKVDYYALDLSKQELSRTLAQLPTFRHVRCHGLLGTYDDGREWLKKPSVAPRPKCIMSLGSSIGNFHRHEAADFLRSFADVLQSSDTALLGADSCNNPSKIYYAYNVLTNGPRFILNGLRHANDVFGEQVFNLDDWKVIGEYVYDEEGGRHQAFLAPKRDVVIMGEIIKANERIQIEQSLKYSAEDRENLWNAAGLTEIERWMTEDGDYGGPSQYASSNIPSLKDWEGLWVAWDTVTQRMLPREALLNKPIKLRNACIFYLGHIPAFLDIQLTKVTKKGPTEPSFYHDIFERGIDPDVDNPELCHQHSEIPDEWPPVEDLLEYQGRVRARLIGLYSDGLESIPRDIGRAIWVGFEHEIMHLETLLYMMLQSDKTLPPHTVRPDFEALALQARSARVENEWFDIPEQEITLGLDDPEDVLAFDGHFGWDNEKPSRKVKYARYMHNNKVTKLPASWAEDQPTGNGDVDGAAANGLYEDGHSDGSDGDLPARFLEGKAVRTVYGLVPLRHALDWPVFASYDELDSCAAWMGERIPTFEEARSIYAYVDHLRREPAENQLGKTVPAVNAHLVNDGVEETPPQTPVEEEEEDDGARGSTSRLFVDLAGANVGLRRWHPVAVTGYGDRLAGQAEMGGVWEWTSSPLRRHEGFEPMALYPGYTADFFDEKHNIVLGGSWATHPRIAGRKSFVNWYQRNYPYAWVGARLVRDL